MLRLTLHGALVLIALTLTACPPKGETSTHDGKKDPKKEAPGEPLAKVSDTVITVEQIQKRLDDQSPFVRVRYTDPAKKKEFVESQVRFEVLASEAFARGLDKDPEVLEATKKLIVQKLTREEFDNRVKLTDVADADLQKYFDAHQADYQKPEMVRANDVSISFTDAASKAAAKKKADEAAKKAVEKGKLDEKNTFKDVVAAYSTDEATKRAGGDLRYMTPAEVEQRLGTAARTWLFAADTVNEVSPVIEGPNAFHVFKRTANRKAITRSFDQVKNQIKNVVFREKRTDAFNAYVDELKTKHHVTMYEDKLDKIKVNAQLPPNVDENGNPRGVDPHAGVMGLPPPPPTEEQAEAKEHGEHGNHAEAKEHGEKHDGKKDDDENDEGGEGKR